METCTKCHCISKGMKSRKTICHDYIAISHTAEIYNLWSREYSLRQRSNIPSMVEASKERLERLMSSPRGKEVELSALNPAPVKNLKERFKTFPWPFAWVNPNSMKDKSIASIFEDAGMQWCG